MRLPRLLRVRLKRLAYGGVGGGHDGERVVAWLGVEPGMRVADIGSGFGDFAARFAAAVGPSGAVYAVDTDPDLRQEVARLAERRGLPQLRTIAARDDDPGIDTPVDLVFLASSFHHLPDRVRYFGQVRLRLRPGGRVAILEGRPARLSGWFGHSTPPAEVVATLEKAGFHRLDGADLVRWASLQTFVPTSEGGPLPA
jgi:SAM-dependent methyltransferase